MRATRARPDADAPASMVTAAARGGVDDDRSGAPRAAVDGIVEQVPA